MVSEWMPNGNIDQYVKAHWDANRFELVSLLYRFLPPPLPVNDCMASIVGGRREGLDIHARSGNGPWRSQGGKLRQPGPLLISYTLC